jgi:polyhydroxyalkanoate synthase subunit PhaC
MTEDQRVPRRATDIAIGLDALLADAPAGPLRLLPGVSGLRTAAALAVRPAAVVRRGAVLAAELARIGFGRSRLAPGPHDERYADPAWTTHPLLRRFVQTHLAVHGAAQGLIADADLGPEDTERVRTAVDALADALAPSNTPLHPTAWRTALDSGGASAARGALRLVTDLAARPRVPTPAASGVFELGADLAATPGAVVLRTPVFELLQYLPQTETVHEVPLVIVPPVLNRYYLADLSPGRSIVEHLVQGGVQVFAISWRNTHGAHAFWDLHTYGQAVLDAMDAAEHITRTHRTSLMAFGAGGTITAMLLGHLAAMGSQDRVASVTFAATVLDGGSVPPDPGAADDAVAASERQGYLDGRALLAELAWRAPDALLWPLWVRSYLCGRPPAASDVLAWMTDTTRIPAGLHRDLVDVALREPLDVPGAASLLGTPIDLAKVDRDCYVVAGAADPRTPWVDAYRTTCLLAGSSRFVLATGGDAASLVTPPGTPGAQFRATVGGGEPLRRMAAADPTTGSWWEDHLAWLVARSGPQHDAPPELGGRGMHALAPAPGEYVLHP